MFAATDEVLMVNAGETVAPAGTVTDGGTVAAALLLESVTTAPLEGAATFNVTVAEVAVPPLTVAGESVTADAAGGVTVRVAVAAAPPL